MNKPDNFHSALAAVEGETKEPVATFDNSAPWPVEPDETSIKDEMARGTPREDAIKIVRAKMIDGAKRLASFAPEAAEAIQKTAVTANLAADEAAAAQRAAESAESAVVSGVIQYGEIRRKLAIFRRLELSDADEKNLAQSALKYFVLKSEAPTTENSSGWEVFSTDLVVRIALKKHLPDFIKSLEQSAETTIAKIKAEAEANKINLNKLMAVLFRESGKPGHAALDPRHEFYAGLI